jgi:hypothetical protein
MKKMLIMMSAILSIATSGFAQTTVIDYGTISPTGCNVFYPPISVGGKTHTTTLGQVYYDPTNAALDLPAKLQGTSSPVGTRFAISYTCLPNHTYSVTIQAKGTVSGSDPTIFGICVNSITPAGSCNGPQPDPNPAQSGQTGFIGSTTFQNYTFQPYNPPSGANYIEFKAIGGSSTQNVSALIKKITITDVTPVTPTFTITSSVASRTCGTALLSPITFTVNSQNATNITGYDYIVTPYQWMTGFPATWVTGTIHQTSNIISLDPIECGTGSSITVIPYINNVAQAPVTKTITINTPSFSIAGPSSLNMVSALYDLQSSPTSGPVCGVIPTWSVSNGLVQLYVNSATNVGLSPNINALGSTILQAVIPQCGINVTATKTISVTGPPRRINAPFSGLEETSNESINVTPNPSNGVFNLHLGKSLDKAKLSIISIDGKEVFNAEVNGSNQSVDLSASPAGIYLLKINTGKTIETKKLVKTK